MPDYKENMNWISILKISKFTIKLILNKYQYIRNNYNYSNSNNVSKFTIKLILNKFQ